MIAGLLAVVAVPAGIFLARYSDRITLIRSAYGSAPAGAVLGLYAILLARRGRETVQRTLGRAGGEGAARVGRVLGVAGLCVATTAGMALGFYGLLTIFAQ